MRTHPLRVFVSSTFKDLREYRGAVREVLNRLSETDVSMEYFGASDYGPTEFSLQKLTTCNVYVGIIGHRYGSLTPDRRQSIVEAEYLHAQRLWRAGKMRILLYMADKSLDVPDDLIEPEPDALQRRQAAFRESLTIHTLQTFRTPYELAICVASDLYKVLRSAELPEGGGPRIFDQDDWPKIEAGFDASEERVKKIETFLEFVTESFKDLFHIDPTATDLHPFIGKASAMLKSAIPGVSLDAKNGTLIRTGVHHIMLRADTAVTLLKNIDPRQLQTVAEEIGRSAAKDLIENKVKPPKDDEAGERLESLIPASAEMLVKLWAYWDRTGGWGQIQLMKPAPYTEGEKRAPDSKPKWRLKIDNNFLGRDTTAAEANKLAGFWGGYIKGFLNYALPEIRGVMQHLPENERSRVRLPAYKAVESVEHVPDNSAREDTFIVTFKQQQLSDARRASGQAHDALRKGQKAEDDPEQAKTHYDDMVAACRFVVLSARHELGPRFDDEFQRMEFSAGGRAIIEEILANQGPPEMDNQVAQAWFDACNHLIQRLSDAIEGVL